MEILVQVPTSLQFLVEWCIATWASLQGGWNVVHVLTQFVREFASRVVHLQYNNIFLPMLAGVFFFWPILLSLFMSLAAAWTWIFWLVASMTIGLLQVLYASYQFFMITMDIMCLSTLKTYTLMRNQWRNILDRITDGPRGRHSARRRWKERTSACSSYEDFLRIRVEPKPVETFVRDTALGPVEIQRSTSFTVPQEDKRTQMRRNRSFNGRVHGDDFAVCNPVVTEELGNHNANLLTTTTYRLEEARLSVQSNPNDEEAAKTLQYLLSGVVKRNHLAVDELLVENARSIAVSGEYGLSTPSRQVVRSYLQEVEKGLNWIADAAELECTSAIGDRMNLVRKMKQNMGRTALMLSGGGAQAMYHLGVVRALIESKLYDDITVVSGTSGGSIMAGLVAMKTSEELYNEVCVRTVSTDYRLNGSMKKQNIRWFPSMWEMATYWMKHKLLVDGKEFQRTCAFYYGDTTFEEAFVRTGKHVCITVSASRTRGASAQRLLLNHISTPHVTISSAVRASCGLPGVMAPAKLIVKDCNGNLEPFEVDGVEWIDGSVHADLPFQRISSLFAVTNFIVSQTNFHVVPFLNKAHHPNQKSLYWRLFQTLEWDIRSRALKLSRLGLFPKFFGQDISKVFKQRYHGNLTIVPRFTTMQTFGLQALSNPSVKDMEGYLKHGQLATWPYLNAIRDMIRLEKLLDDCLARLDAKMRSINPDIDWSTHDDVDSIASSAVNFSSSSRVRIIGRPPTLSERGSSALRQRVVGLEMENQQLRDELACMRQAAHIQNDNHSKDL